MATDDEKRTKLKKKVEKMASVSTISVVLNRILEVAEEEDSSREDLEHAIEHDQSIAAKVVEMANNAYYGFSGKITTISGAIPVLGFDTVKGLAVSAAAFEDMTKGGSAKVMVFWSHSFEVAMVAGMIAKKTRLMSREAPFVAALLHDIGRAILFQFFGGDYLDVSDENMNKLLAEERELFGADHAEVGAWFGAKCNFQNDMVKAIRYHHHPERHLSVIKGDSHSYILPIVYLADHIVSIGDENIENDSVISPEHQQVLDMLCLDEEQVAEIAEELEELRPEIHEFYE